MGETVLRLSPQFFAEEEPVAVQGEGDVFDAPDLFESEEPEEGQGTWAEEPSSEETPPDEPVTEPEPAPEEAIPAPQPSPQQQLARTEESSENAAAFLQPRQTELSFSPDGQAGREPPEFSVLDRYAAANGMTRAEYVAALDRQFQESQMDQERQQVLQQYPGAAPELVEQVARGNIQRREEEQQRQMLLRQVEEQRQKEQPWAEFFGRVSGVTADTIPKAVFEQVAAGMSPLAAWYEHQNRELERQLAVRQQNERNQKTAIGSIQDTAAAEGKDPFLEAFDRVFSE